MEMYSYIFAKSMVYINLLKISEDREFLIIQCEKSRRGSKTDVDITMQQTGKKALLVLRQTQEHKRRLQSQSAHEIATTSLLVRLSKRNRRLARRV